jgi:hypothetical protein
MKPLRPMTARSNAGWRLVPSWFSTPPRLSIVVADPPVTPSGVGPSSSASAAIEVDLGECRIGAIAFALDGGAGPSRERRRGDPRPTGRCPAGTCPGLPSGDERWRDWQSDERAVYREWVSGTEVEAIYAFLAIPTATSDATAELLLRRSDRMLARFRSAELAGSLRVGGVDYAVVVDGASVLAVDLTRSPRR